MEYLVGAMLATGIFLNVMGYIRFQKRQRKPIKHEADEEQVRKAKELRKGFEQLMSYDVSKATGKRVT